MSRRRSVALALIALVALAAVALAVAAFGRDDAPVATVRVKKAPYVREVTAEGNFSAVKSTVVATPRQAEVPLKLAWIADDGAPVREGEVIARFDSTDFEKELEEGETEHARTGNRIAGAEATAGAIRANLGRDAWLADRELEAAQMFQKRDAGIYSRFELIESEIDEGLAVEKKEFAQEMQAVRSTLFRADREILGIEQRRADQRIDRAQKALSALEVTAPHDGILVLLRNWRGELPRVGDVAWRGNPIGEIPDLAAMKVEAFVLEADAGGIAAGQPARVVVESHPGKVFEATVEKVDPIAKTRFRGSPVQYFGVTLALAKTDPEVMKPGARVRATITLEKSEGAIALPRQAIFERDGERVVYIRRGGRFEAVPVELGSATVGSVLIAKGLEEGDEVALEEPRDVVESAR